MKTLFAAIAVAILLAGFRPAPPPQETVWVSLFNGRDLSGWRTIPGGSWTVEDGMIVGRAGKEDKRHGLLVSGRSFRDFEVEVTYKALKGNSGLYFRVSEVGGDVGVHGFQAEIDPNADAGGLYETGGRGWVVQPKPARVRKYFRPGRWNTMRVRAVGGDITVTVNGVVSAELKNDPGNAEGPVALQLHGGQDMHVIFREVKIREL